MPDGEISTRRTRRHYFDATTDARFRKLSERHELWREFYTSMLLQDIQHLFPYPQYHENFRAEIRPAEAAAEIEAVVAAALVRERARYGHRELAAAIRDFGAECAPHLLAFGSAAYELALISPSHGERPRSFRLHLIHPYRRFLGTPQHYLLGADGTRGRWIRLPEQSVVEFRLPRRRRNEVARAIDALAAANRHNVVRSRLMFSPGLPYRLAHHASMERELLARATAPIGWRGRGLFTDEQLEPYRLIRDLRFEGFQAELRQLIHAGINRALARAGKEIGFGAQIDLHGLQDLDDVADEIRRVEEGPGPTVSLQSVLRSFR